MRIPRFPFDAPPFVFQFRRAQVDFDEFHLTNQAEQIIGTQGTLRITPVGMYMFSQIAGRRIVEPIKWILGECLDEILKGNLRTEHPEQQDLLASTFGETLGAMMTCWRLGGNLRIIRLLENNEEKSPDYILMNDSHGHIEEVHLLECKGAVEDLNNVKKKRKLDICIHIRSFRDEAYEQLTSSKLGESVGRGLSVAGHRITRPVRGFTRNLAVTVVPDSRLLQESDSESIKVGRKLCRDGKRNRCFRCMRVNPRTSQFIYVHHQEEISPSQKSSRDDQQSMEAIRRFIETYEPTWRALWTEDDGTLEDRLIKLHETTDDKASRDPIVVFTNEMVCRLAEAACQADLDIDRAVENVLKKVSGTYRRRLEKISDRIKTRKALGQIKLAQKRYLSHKFDLPDEHISVRQIEFFVEGGRVIKLYALDNSNRFEDHLKYAVSTILHTEGIHDSISWRTESVDFYEHDGTYDDIHAVDPSYSYIIGHSWVSPDVNSNRPFSKPCAWISCNGIAELFLPC